MVRREKHDGKQVAQARLRRKVEKDLVHFVHIEINRFRGGAKERIGAKGRIDSPAIGISIHRRITRGGGGGGEHDDICVIDDSFARETRIPAVYRSPLKPIKSTVRVISTTVAFVLEIGISINNTRNRKTGKPITYICISLLENFWKR